MNSRETFYRNGRMHVLLIAAGSLAILVKAFIDIDGRGVVPFKVYVAAHLAIYAGVLKRPELKRLASAVPPFLLTIPLTYVAMSSVGHALCKFKPGMTVSQVQEVMKGYEEVHRPGLASPGKLIVPAGCLAFRDRYASLTLGVVVIKNGRVTEVYIDDWLARP